MSLQIPTFLKETGLGIPIVSGATALTSVLLPTNPLGVLGGAAFGAIHYISMLSLTEFGMTYLKFGRVLASKREKFFEAAFIMLGSYIIAWGVFSAAGVSLALSYVIPLSAMSLAAAPVALLLAGIFHTSCQNRS